MELTQVLGKHDVAVVIAVESYIDTRSGHLPTVDFARADAEAFAQVLRDHGVPDDQIELYIDEDASLARIENDVAHTIRTLGPHQRLVFYYAGHGFHDGGQNVLTTHGSTPSNLATSTFGLRDFVFDELDRSQTKRALVFIDACARPINSIGGARESVGNLNRADLEAFASAAPYRAVFTSCSEGQASHPYDPSGHGLWTHYLLGALTSDVAGDESVPGVVTTESLHHYLAVEVRQAAANLGKVQNPYAYVHAAGPISLVEIPVPESSASTGLIIPENAPVVFVLNSVVDITRLDGFITSKHSVPKGIDPTTREFVRSIFQDEAEREVREVQGPIRKALGARTRQVEYWSNSTGGHFTAPGVQYSVSVRQDEDSERTVVIRRRLTVSAPTPELLSVLDEFLPEHLDSVLVSLRQPSKSETFYAIVDALEDEEAEGGDLSSYPGAESAIFLTPSGQTVYLELGDAAPDGQELQIRARPGSRTHLSDVLADARDAITEIGPAASQLLDELAENPDTE